MLMRLAVLPSHSARVRGLKLSRLNAWNIFFPSHSARVRGLKLRHIPLRPHRNKVALRAGAWIETAYVTRSAILRSGSHSARVRGLKQYMVRLRYCPYCVALRAGAWIETI